MSTTNLFAISLGGEGEHVGVLNQQPPFALGPNWLSQTGQSLAELTASGTPFLICPNDAIALPDESVDVVYTDDVPLDTVHPYYGPGVQRSEIERILKSGGRWIHNGQLQLVKP